MSEEPDFGADCGIDSLDNCLKQIEVSDYYFLIIGNKPGTILNYQTLRLQSLSKNSDITYHL